MNEVRRGQTVLGIWFVVAATLVLFFVVHSLTTPHERNRCEGLDHATYVSVGCDYGDGMGHYF